MCGLEHRDKREIILKSQRYRKELSFVCCVIATCIAIYSIIFYFSVIFPDMCWWFFFYLIFLTHSTFCFSRLITFKIMLQYRLLMTSSSVYCNIKLF